MAETEDDRAVKGAYGAGVRGQVSVVPPGCDRGEAHASRVDLHHRHRAVPDRDRREAGLELLQPSAVVHDQSRPHWWRL